MTDQPDQSLPVTDRPDQSLPNPLPRDGNPNLEPYAQWRQDEDKGSRAAHDDARLPTPDRMDPDAVAAEGPAFLNGYNRHMADLRDAGVIA